MGFEDKLRWAFELQFPVGVLPQRREASGLQKRQAEAVLWCPPSSDVVQNRQLKKPNPKLTSKRAGGPCRGCLLSSAQQGFRTPEPPLGGSVLLCFLRSNSCSIPRNQEGKVPSRHCGERQLPTMLTHLVMKKLNSLYINQTVPSRVRLVSI